jgi:hypothetical protein
MEAYQVIFNLASVIFIFSIFIIDTRSNRSFIPALRNPVESFFPSKKDKDTLKLKNGGSHSMVFQ